MNLSTIIALAVCILLNLADALQTSWALRRGMFELNPIVRWIGTDKIWFIKGGICLFTVLLTVFLQTILIPIVSGIPILGVVVWNSVQMFKRTA